MSRVVAKRYARALFELASEHNRIDAIERDVKVIASALQGDAAFRKWLAHPQVPAQAKKEIVASLFGGKIDEAVVHLFDLLIDRGRELLLPVIADAFFALVNERRGVADAVVTTAVPLSAEALQQVAHSFGAKLGKTLRASNVVDAGIIGGIVVRIGDRLYDGSVAGKLARFKSKLGQTKAL